MGSFYLVNLILAIVAMSYDEQQKQDQLDEEAEEENQFLMAVSDSHFQTHFAGLSIVREVLEGGGGTVGSWPNQGTWENLRKY